MSQGHESPEPNVELGSPLGEDQVLEGPWLDHFTDATEAFDKLLHDFLLDAHSRQEGGGADNEKMCRLVGIGALSCVLRMIHGDGAFVVDQKDLWLALRKSGVLGSSDNYVDRLLEFLAGAECQLCMSHWHPGQVARTFGEEVVVVYEVDDDLVEHTYHQSRFLSEGVPKEGDRVQIFVQLLTRPPQSEESSETPTGHRRDEGTRRRRHTIRGPQEF